MIVPSSKYNVVVKFDSTIGRWAAVFTSEKYTAISYAFPLPDEVIHGCGNEVRGSGRPHLAGIEERLLALTFNQMTEATVAEHARQREAAQQQMQSATQQSLAE